MYVIVGFPSKWQGISKNCGMVSGLPTKVSSDWRCQFEGKCVHENTTEMRCTLDLWLSSRVEKVTIGVVLATVQKSSYTMVNCYSREMVEQNIWSETYFVCLFLWGVFGNTGAWTQELTLARQTLCHLIYSTSQRSRIFGKMYPNAQWQILSDSCVIASFLST
jgi:hypothetical protein